MKSDKASTATGTSVVAETTPRCPDDPTSLTEIFGRFLRLHVTEGDASPATIRTYHAQAGQFAAWCQQQRLSPSIAPENDAIAYRKYLVETGYKPTTIAQVGCRPTAVRTNSMACTQGQQSSGWSQSAERQDRSR